MSQVQDIYALKMADAPIQFVFRMQQAIEDSTGAMIPPGALYRVLDVDRNANWDDEGGVAYMLTVSSIEFTEANESLCTQYFEDWSKNRLYHREMERSSFWVMHDTDLGDRVLTVEPHVDSRKTLQSAVARLVVQACHYAPNASDQSADDWYQAIANACLKRGDVTSKLSLVVRHLI